MNGFELPEPNATLVTNGLFLCTLKLAIKGWLARCVCTVLPSSLFIGKLAVHREGKECAMTAAGNGNSHLGWVPEQEEEERRIRSCSCRYFIVLLGHNSSQMNLRALHDSDSAKRGWRLCQTDLVLGRQKRPLTGFGAKGCLLYVAARFGRWTDTVAVAGGQINPKMFPKEMKCRPFSPYLIGCQ